MHLRIRSQTAYHYDSEAIFSPHLVRLFPRQDRYIDVVSAEFSTSPEALVYHQRDQFDNQVARCVYQKPGQHLEFNLDLELNIQERSAFDFLVDLHAVHFPFHYRESEFQALQPYLLQPGSEVVHHSQLLPTDSRLTTLEVLIQLNQNIFSQLRYERRDEGEAMLPAETLQQGAGSCRDFSRLAASLLRNVGVAVRLVSGYLVEIDVPDADRRSEGSLHAWLEAYIPGAGWLGMDPTNGILTNHLFIPTAVGLHPNDIAPSPGTVSATSSSIPTSSLTIELLA